MIYAILSLCFIALIYLVWVFDSELKKISTAIHSLENKQFLLYRHNQRTTEKAKALENKVKNLIETKSIKFKFKRTPIKEIKTKTSK
jgi:hypothetical protein